MLGAFHALPAESRSSPSQPPPLRLFPDENGAHREAPVFAKDWSDAAGANAPRACCEAETTRPAAALRRLPPLMPFLGMEFATACPTSGLNFAPTTTSSSKS